MCTERLLLRGWSEADVGPYRRILADREVMAGFGSGPIHAAKRGVASALSHLTEVESRRAVARHIDRWEQRGFGLWALQERQGGALVGYAGLLFHDDWEADETQLEVGWMLRRDRWGRGLASEAGAASLAFAFDSLDAERVISITSPRNHRSKRVMHRLGMEPCGRARWRRQVVVWHAIGRSAWEGQTEHWEEPANARA